MKRFVFYIILFLSFSLGTASSQELNPELETIAKELDTELIAPCCWTQPLAEHSSGVTDNIRENIRKMLAEGKTRRAIASDMGLSVRTV